MAASQPALLPALLIALSIPPSNPSSAVSSSDWRNEPQTCGSECIYSRDGECDDGGLGSEYLSCACGSDCAGTMIAPHSPTCARASFFFGSARATFSLTRAPRARVLRFWQTVVLASSTQTTLWADASALCPRPHRPRLQSHSLRLHPCPRPRRHPRHHLRHRHPHRLHRAHHLHQRLRRRCHPCGHHRFPHTLPMHRAHHRLHRCCHPPRRPRRAPRRNPRRRPLHHRRLRHPSRHPSRRPNRRPLPHRRPCQPRRPLLPLRQRCRHRSHLQATSSRRLLLSSVSSPSLVVTRRR